MIKCSRCRLSNKQVNCVPYFGSEHPEVLFCGEMFGSNEAENYLLTDEAKCFVGEAGKKFDELLTLAGFNRDSIGITNVMRCYQHGNPTPTKSELDTCFIYLLRDINRLKPKLIVAMGGSALYATTNKTGIEQYRGLLLQSEKIPYRVFPTFHPAACLYDKSKWEILVEDFKKIKSQIIANIHTIRHYKYKVIDSVEEVRRIFPTIHSIKFDTESTGLSPYKDDLRILQLGGDDDSIIYLLEEDFIPKVRNELEELFNRCEVSGQTYEHDVKMICVKHGIFPKKWGHDTCLAEYALHGTGSNDLTALTSKYNRESAGYDDEINKVGGAHKIFDKGILYQYGADDVGTLYPIIRAQKKKLEERGLTWFYENIMIPTNRILTKMSLRGVTYDLDKLWKVDEIYRKRADRALLKAISLECVKECEKHFRKTFNPRSSDMVRWIIIDYYKLPMLQETDAGKASIGQEEMKRYVEEYDNEYCKIMEDYRSYQVIRDNFLSGVVPKLVGNVALTRYSLHATNSGRPNSKDPNLLNIPREKIVRGCIVARPGYKFVAGDQSQLEVRCAAMKAVYNEPRLRDICNDFDKDSHSAITAQAFKKTYEEVYNGYKSGDVAMTELRVKGKATMFGIVYQEGPSKLSYQLKIPKEEAYEFINGFYDKFPDLRKNIDATKQLLIEQGFLENYFKRRRTWHDHKPDDHKSQREGVNHLVQSLAWDIEALSLISLDKIYEGQNMKSGLVLQVYDSIVTEAKDEEVNDVSAIMKETMQNINKPFSGINDVRLKVDIKVGEDLSEV